MTVNQSFTGIYRCRQNSRPFPEFSGRAAITSGNWSWISGSSNSFASAQGHQMLFTGTMENIVRLRQELKLAARTGAAGTALALYLKYGENFPLKIQGSFCFAILDYITGELLLGRDYLGRRSLFWGKTKQDFHVFSDRLENLKEFFPSALEIDLQGLNEYLGRGCISAPRTIYQNIRRVEAASLIHITADGTVRRQRYWHPEYLPKFTGRFSDAAEQCHALLDEAVRQCSDGRAALSCLLSGGLDSSLVLAHARPFFSGTARITTVSFENPLYDEAPLACLTAAKFGLQLDLVKARAEELQAIGEEWLDHQDEPYSDSSLLPLTLACRSYNREAVSVFTGDGGDEVFGGYRRYQAMLFKDMLDNSLGRSLLKSVYFLQRVLSPGAENRSFRTTLWRFIQAMHQDTLASFLSFQEIFSPDFRQELCSPMLLETPQLPIEDMFACLQAEDDCERCMALDLLNYLPYDCLRKCELAATDSRLEILSPLLARPLVEFALRLPRKWKTTIWQRKRPLRTMAQKMLPGRLLQQKKRGFGVPMGEWFRTVWSGEIRELADTHDQWDRQGWLNSEFISLLIQQHLQGKADHSARIWNLLCLKKWLDKQTDLA